MGPVARRLGRQAPLVPRRLECGQRKWMLILSMKKKKKKKKKKLTRGLYPDVLSRGPSWSGLYGPVRIVMLIQC